MTVQKKPTTRYELLEYLGKAPGLPPGFSYAPIAAFSQVDKMVEIQVDTNKVSQVEPVIASSQQVKVRIPADASVIPPRMVDAIMNDPRRIPYGFLGMSPHPGFDPERLEKGKGRFSSIYGSEINSNRGGASAVRAASATITNKHPSPQGTTYKRHPILWPSKERYYILQKYFDESTDVFEF
jgi:hypothetical protein